jgi:hypothetical protein
MQLVVAFYVPLMAPPEVAKELFAFARALLNPAGEFKGKPYEPSLHPAHPFFLWAVISGRWKNFVIAADTQSGKSWLIQVVLFWYVTELKLDALYGLPDMRFASDVWMKKIRYAMEVSGLGRFLPKSGSGSGGGTDIDSVYFDDAGSLSFFGAGGHRKGGGNDGRTLPVIINDELDSLPREIINKNDARADQFFRQARRFKASTVKDDDDSKILGALAESTQGHLEYLHKACGKWTPMEFEQLDYDATSDKTAAATARIICARCGQKDAFDEDRRQAALKRPRLVFPNGAFCWFDVPAGSLPVPDRLVIDGEIPENTSFGIAWSCFDNPFKPLGEKIAVKHRRAVLESTNGRSRDLIDFYHDDLRRQFPREASEEDLDAIALAQRSSASSYAKGTVPADATFLTAAFDQQLRLLLYVVKAHAADGRTWIIDWNMVNICGPREQPTPAQRKLAYAAGEAEVKRGYLQHGSAHRMIPVIIGMDVADWPDIASEWMRDRSDWMPLHGAGAELAGKMARGEGKDTARLAGWYQLKEQKAHGGEWRILWIEHDEVKHELTRAYARPINSSAAAHLPNGLGAMDLLILHLTSEEWIRIPEKKRFGWVKTRYRFNDYRDCDYYTHALGQYWLHEHPNYEPPQGTAGASEDDDEDGGGGMGAWT